MDALASGLEAALPDTRDVRMWWESQLDIGANPAHINRRVRSEHPELLALCRPSARVQVRWLDQEYQIKVRISKELRAYVSAKVKTGQFLSESDVVRDSLMLSQEQDVIGTYNVLELKRMIDEGMASIARGDVTEFSPAQFMKEAKRRLAKLRAVRAARASCEVICT